MEEQQKVTDLQVKPEKEIKKRQKVEKKVQEVENNIEANENVNSDMETKVLKDVCEEEAKIRKELQADALRKNLNIEHL